MVGVLALAAKHNTEGKYDATRAFIPEARRFLAYWEGEGFEPHETLIDNRRSYGLRRVETEAAIAKVPHLKHLAVFAHGWASGIQIGYRVIRAGQLADAISAVAHDDEPIVSLYCCSTGASQTQGLPGGDGGFADTLRDELCKRGLVHCRVDAHVTAGHTTRNPHVRRFEGQGSWAGGQGGSYPVRPGSGLWGAWKRALRGTLRYQMSQLTVAEIHDQLLGIQNIA